MYTYIYIYIYIYCKHIRIRRERRADPKQQRVAAVRRPAVRWVVVFINSNDDNDNDDDNIDDNDSDHKSVIRSMR